MLVNEEAKQKDLAARKREFMEIFASFPEAEQIELIKEFEEHGLFLRHPCGEAANNKSQR